MRTPSGPEWKVEVTQLSQPSPCGMNSKGLRINLSSIKSSFPPEAKRTRYRKKIEFTRRSGSRPVADVQVFLLGMTNCSRVGRVGHMPPDFKGPRKVVLITVF